MDILFKNVMETLVFDKLDQVIEVLDCCTCPKCRYDIAACALNSLPSKYVASWNGELYTRLSTLNMQYEADIMTALTMAAKKIKDNPQH